MDFITKAVIERMPEVYADLKNDKADFGRNEYICALTEIIGYIPSEREVDRIFQNKTNLSCEELETEVLKTIKYIHFGQDLHNAFLKIDAEHKGYITLYDLQRIYADMDFKEEQFLPWCKVKESFNEVSKNGAIEFKQFLSLFQSENIKNSNQESLQRRLDYDFLRMY